MAILVASLLAMSMSLHARADCKVPKLKGPVRLPPHQQFVAWVDCLYATLLGVETELLTSAAAPPANDANRRPLIFPVESAPSQRASSVEEAVERVYEIILEEEVQLLESVADAAREQTQPTPAETAMPGAAQDEELTKDTTGTGTADSQQHAPAPREDVEEYTAADEGAEQDQDAPLRTKALLDEETTTELHDDTTLLSDVQVKSRDKFGRVSIGPLNIWLGGTLQYELYHLEDIYNFGSEGEGDTDSDWRRIDAIFRARVFDWGEVKAQYDVQEAEWKDLYLRWVSRFSEKPYTITFGNQKEPMGLNWLTGSAFTTAVERAAPVAAFNPARGLGVRAHRAFRIPAQERRLDYLPGEDAAMTTSLGVFTEDINNDNDTDLSVTGRVTAGFIREGAGTHLGVGANWREAKDEYDSISFRPEIDAADTIVLARPSADRLAVLSLEAAHGSGSLHWQAEAYYADYEGDVDGYGAGAYLQAGWFVTGQRRRYEPHWGIFRPLQLPKDDYAIELVSRFSYTRAEDDINDWNAYSSLTLGGNLYYRRFRGSLNILYGKARDAVDDQDDGLGMVARLQFLF